MSVEGFRAKLGVTGVITSGRHSVFSQGLHGQKVDFDRIRPGSQLDDEWTDINVWALRRAHPYIRPGHFLVSIANGTLRLVDAMGHEMQGQVGTLHTEKDPESSMPYLTKDAQAVIADLDGRRGHRLTLVEDTSTTGRKAAFIARQVVAINEDLPIEMQTTLQRQDQLPELDALGIGYRAIIHEVMPTYTEAQCQLEGFCATGEEPIPYKG